MATATHLNTGTDACWWGLAHQSDPSATQWPRSSDKRYARDNRLICPESPDQRACLAPRCRLITSWLRRSFQGFVCSPIKVVRELGLDRREAGWSLSTSRSGVKSSSYERSRRSPATRVAPRGAVGGHVRPRRHAAIVAPRIAWCVVVPGGGAVRRHNARAPLHAPAKAGASTIVSVARR